MCGNSEQQAQTSSTQTTENIDNRVAAGNNGQAIRVGDNGQTNITLNSSDATTLQAIASGAMNLLTTLSNNQNDLLTSVNQTTTGSNQALLQSALGSIETLKQTELTGGASNLQKTVLIGLGLGVAGMIAVTLVRRKS